MSDNLLFGAAQRWTRCAVGIGAAISLSVAAPLTALAQTAPASGEITAAGKDGEAFAHSGKEGAASIPHQAVNPDVITGYAPARDDLTNLFGSDPRALNQAGGSAVGSDDWQEIMGGDSWEE